MESDFEDDIRNAVECLRKGGIILYPTDTIWGIGCDARNPEAVEKIYNLKKRADEKAMLVLVDNVPALERIIDQVPEVAYQILDTAVNPLTIIYDDAVNVAPNLIAKDGSLGVRITKENFSSSLCKKMKGAIVSTSANISGEKSPRSFAEISDEIKQGVDYIVKYRQEENIKAQPSNIIKLSKNGVVNIIR